MNQQQRELKIKALSYKYIAIFFAVAGACLFLYLYMEKVDGRMYQALQNPFSLIILLFPFLPALVLGFLSMSADKKLAKTLESNKDAS